MSFGGGNQSQASDRPEHEVAVALDDMKFSAAHFVAYKGFREPLHGHNYTVGVRVAGPKLQEEGYLCDFGELKKVVRSLCRQLDHKTLLPMKSDVLAIKSCKEIEDHYEISCEGGARMLLPSQDCALLPIAHTTAEELAEYLWLEMVRGSLGAISQQRELQWLEVSVSERLGQIARHRAAFPSSRASLAAHRLTPSNPRPCMAALSGGDEEVLASALPYAEDQRILSRQHSLYSLRSKENAAAASPIAEAAFRQILASLGREESSRPELLKTPFRAAKAFKEMTCGCSVQDPLLAVGEGVFEVEGAQDMVAVRDIPFHSMCEHHLLPFSGTAHVAYIPNGRVLGLSKFARLLNVFARRLQLQERLTQQFAEAIEQLLSPKAVMVSMEAHHSCMSHRGASVPSSTRTNAVRGILKDDPSLREQLFLGVSRGHSAKL
eukprot:TRINITY_DN9517_c0_g1_i1.p1 TRINITY_DN9517_c0_g1~~TRINITY_DN9517_c0_g1_i1.p1  ORF type:complete len:435 (-),score=58.02 TRINITY_DN9517_c0_g1_i1:265-1569(-)